MEIVQCIAKRNVLPINTGLLKAHLFRMMIASQNGSFCEILAMVDGIFKLATFLRQSGSAKR